MVGVVSCINKPACPPCAAPACAEKAPCAEFVENMGEQFSEFVENQVEKFSDMKPEPIKKPAFKKCAVKNYLEYLIEIDGGNQATYDLRVGHFEINQNDLVMYATLAENGLITLSTKAIKCSGGPHAKYSTWADVALTAKGKRYISKDNAANEVKSIHRSQYKNILHPVKDRNAYGELEEELVTDPEIIDLFSSFYADYPVSEKVAVKKYGEEEFAEAYSRLLRIDSYMKTLASPTVLPSNSFLGGTVPADPEVLQVEKVYKVTKYLDCYKVCLNGGHEVMLILTPEGDKIFDLVLDEPNGVTVRTKNAKWTEENIKKYAEMAAAPAKELVTEDELGLEKQWYAPGLILVVEDDPDRFVYLAEKADEIEQYVSIVLYENVIDKILNVDIITKEAEDDLGNAYEYYAEAKVVMKKVKISPFQYILQKQDYVSKVSKKSIYDMEPISLKSFDDKTWGIR